MHIVKHVRQYYTSFHDNDVAITSSDIAKAMGTHKRPNVGVDNIIEEAQMDLYKSYLQHAGLSAEAATKAASSSFPTPHSYNDFLLFQSPNPPEAQRPCKHIRHLAERTQIFTRHCPECMFSIHLHFLDMISSKLATERALCLSDPKRSAGIGTRYHRIKAAWVYARATLANYVRLLDLLAAREHSWEARHSRHISPEAKSAAKALQVAASSSDQFLKTHDETTPNPDNSPGISPKGMPKPTKRVTFAGNNNQPASSRPRQTYCRSNKAYKPGKHACPSQSEWLNTSALHEWRASIAQCKLFIENTTSNTATPLLQQGFVWEYKYRKDVMRFLGDRASSSNEARRARYLERLHGCDAVVLVKPRLVKSRDTAALVREAVAFEDVELVIMERENGARVESALADLRLDDKQVSAEIEGVAEDLVSDIAVLNGEEEEEEEVDVIGYQ
jgi:hypothetical protein